LIRTASAGGPVAAVAPLRHLKHVDFVVLSLYWVAIGYLWQSLATLILPDLVQSLVGSAHKGVALSTLEGIGTVMAVVWQPLAGSISDRTRTRWGRRRPFVFAGTVGDVLFLTGIALSGSYWMVVVFYFLLQTASNTAQGPYQGWMPDVVPEDQRGTASGYYGVANIVGILAGTVGAGIMLGHFGRTAAIASIAALLIVTMLVTVVLVPDRAEPKHERFDSPWQAVRTTFARPLAYPQFMWLMASRLLILMGIVGIQSFVFYYFSDTYFHGDSRQTTSATTALVGTVVIVALLVTWPAAWLSDRIGRRPLILASGVLAAIGTLDLVFSHYMWAPADLLAPLSSTFHVPALAAQATLAGVVIGIGFGAFESVDWAFVQDVIPHGESGLFMGFSNIATAGSGVIARFIAGGLLDVFNAGPPILGLKGGYPVIFTLFFVWLAAGSLAILKVREPRR
jgi:MFS family permease